jgi:hypothetical protein
MSYRKGVFFDDDTKGQAKKNMRHTFVHMKLRYLYKNSQLLLSQLIATTDRRKKTSVRNYTKYDADSHAHRLQQSVETKRASTKYRFLSARQIVNTTTTRSTIVASKCAVLRRDNCTSRRRGVYNLSCT